MKRCSMCGKAASYVHWTISDYWTYTSRNAKEGPHAFARFICDPPCVALITGDSWELTAIDLAPPAMVALAEQNTELSERVAHRLATGYV